MRLTAIILMILLTAQLKAQHYTRDAGTRIGAYPALCYRQYTNENTYSEVMVSMKRNAFRLTYLKEFTRPAFSEWSPDLVFVYGFGAHSGFNHIDHYKFMGRTYYYDHYRYSPVLGIDGYLGLEYHFPRLPVIGGIDAKPFFEYSVNQFFSIHMWDISAIFKIKF
jgi:hypothetical protein